MRLFLKTTENRRNREKMKGFKTWTALLLAGIMLLTGCSSEKNTSTESGQPAGGHKTAAEATETEKSMGRYLEKEIVLPEEATTMSSYPKGYLKKLDSGGLMLAELASGIYISGDNGETWEHKEAPWLTDLAGKAYISQISLAPNGAAAVIYDPYEDEENADTEESEKISGAAAAEALENTEASDAESSYRPQYFYADPEGNAKPIEYQDGDEYLHQFWFGKDSRLYAYGMNHKVYEVNTEDGTIKELFETEGLADYVCFTERYMVVFTSREVAVYDMGTGMLSDEDMVLQSFIMDNLGEEIGSTSDEHSVVAVEGEQEDVIYFAFNKGLYRHVIGGTAMEQIVDGTISSLGDPMMSLEGIEVLPDNEFAVLYSGVKLYRYTYDPDVPTVPEEQIGVYSLTENYSVRQAVSLFQKQNPDVYIRYEVGMSGDNGATAEDAIKNLNTKMMSGSGPDILVLDGLPADSYKEKGVLADLGSVVDNLNGEDSLFPNLVEACREEGKIYSLPVRFQLPMIAGGKENIQSIADLGTLADTVERLREENPEGPLIGLKTENEILYTLGQICSAAWMDDGKNINKEALAEFLTNARRIYQAETAGMDAQYLEEYKVRMQDSDSAFPGERKYYASTSSNAISFAAEGQKLAVGKVYGLDFDFNVITTLAEQEEDFAYTFWEGQVKDGFIPATSVGIYAKSAENELAVKFFRFLFGRDLQDLALPDGFPMNMASFDTFSESGREEEFGGGSFAMSNENGDFFSLDINWASETDFQKLKEMVQSVSRISTGNAVIERVVCEIGPKALKGSSSVEDAVDEIIKKAAIYLAE